MNNARSFRFLDGIRFAAVKAMTLATATLCCWTTSLQASPDSDLSSPSQKIRDAAASFLLTHYAPPARTNWEPLLESIKIGETRLNVELALPKSSPIARPRWMFDDNIAKQDLLCQLDNSWQLRVQFQNSGTNIGYDAQATATAKSLELNLLPVVVLPSSTYSGMWTCYFPNGQKANEGHYKQGKLDGEGTQFENDGTKVVMHFVKGEASGKVTGYYASGRVQFHGSLTPGQIAPGYRAPRPSGRWIWYNEDGSVKSTQDHPR